MEQLKNFKNLFFLGIVLWIVECQAQKSYTHPLLPKSGKEIQALIPNGWQILSQASGDLNGDGRIDVAFAIESPEEENYLYAEDTISDTLQTNPRIMGIYFGKRNGKFKKVQQSNSFIINRNTPNMDEPFKGLQILENGELQISFQIWPCRNCSSWSSHEYRFRYQNKAFELIAYSQNVSQRVSGEEVDYSIDFKKRILRIMTTTINEIDERQYEEELKNFELKQLQTLKSLSKPLEWKFQDLRI